MSATGWKSTSTKRPPGSESPRYPRPSLRDREASRRHRRRRRRHRNACLRGRLPAASPYRSARSNVARVPVFCARSRAEDHGFVAYIHSRNRGAELARLIESPPELHWRWRRDLSFEFAEEVTLLLEKRAATVTEEPREVSAMAVVGIDHGVPRQSVLLSEVPAVHRRILHRSRFLVRPRSSERLRSRRRYPPNAAGWRRGG